MYKRYCIEQQEIEKLTGALEAKSLWDEAKYAEWKKTLQQKLERYIENNPRNEKLKADEIYNLFYPEKDIPIFISHSSKNKDIAQKLALWLKEKLGLYSFIDSDLWGNISEIQRSLDNKYCKSGTKFDYEKRNQCTAHVHMILTYALTRMIDKSDFFIFVKSNQSVSLQDSVQRTNSSWIFHELVTASLIRTKSSFELFPTGQLLCESRQKPPIPISYPIPLDDFDMINRENLISMAEAYSNLRMDKETGSFGKYQLAHFWGQIRKGQGNPSNDVIAKNCLLGFKRKK